MAALISEAWPWMRELGGGGGLVTAWIASLKKSLFTFNVFKVA